MMTLIDTQSFIRFTEDDAKMPSKIKNIMNNRNNVLLLSIVSLWEITIKISIGKLKTQKNIDNMIKDISEYGFEILPIRFGHLLELSNFRAGMQIFFTLPFPARHPVEHIR
jgi:PIN domain nuclease of toxin-antitoxin system